jgi:esterase/lipase superfamily enzyme
MLLFVSFDSNTFKLFRILQSKDIGSKMDIFERVAFNLAVRQLKITLFI